MSLPLVYAVTYHLSFSSMYTSEWLMISVFLSPLVLLFAGIRYGFARLKQQERQVMNKVKILEKCQNFSRIFIATQSAKVFAPIGKPLTYRRWRL